MNFVSRRVVRCHATQLGLILTLVAYVCSVIEHSATQISIERTNRALLTQKRPTGTYVTIPGSVHQQTT
jgi:uncharacterized membrane protein